MDLNTIIALASHAICKLNAGEKVDLTISISNDSISATDYSQSTSIPIPTDERKVATPAEHRLFMSNAISGMELQIPLRLGAALIDASKCGCAVSFTIDPPREGASKGEEQATDGDRAAVQDAVKQAIAGDSVKLRAEPDWGTLQPMELGRMPGFFGSLMEDAKQAGIFATVTVKIDGRPADDVTNDA
jgi:hypothetical protein